MVEVEQPGAPCRCACPGRRKETPRSTVQSSLVVPNATAHELCTGAARKLAQRDPVTGTRLHGLGRQPKRKMTGPRGFREQKDGERRAGRRWDGPSPNGGTGPARKGAHARRMAKAPASTSLPWRTTAAKGALPAASAARRRDKRTGAQRCAAAHRVRARAAAARLLRIPAPAPAAAMALRIIVRLPDRQVLEQLPGVLQHPRIRRRRSHQAGRCTWTAAPAVANAAVAVSSAAAALRSDDGTRKRCRTGMGGTADTEAAATHIVGQCPVRLADLRPSSASAICLDLSDNASKRRRRGACSLAARLSEASARTCNHSSSLAP